MIDRDPKNRNKIVLGWQMNAKQEPKYWVGSNPIVGRQSSDELVTVPPELIAFHTAIIAQSGSGKSFFLGRLIEEILVRTKARCIIFDPNADFRKIHEIEDKRLWESAKYDRETGRGKLPHEASRAKFEKQWAPVCDLTRIKVGAVDEFSKHSESLQLRWSSLSVEFLAEELEPRDRSDLYNCHTFAQDVELLFRVFGCANDKSPEGPVLETEKLFSETDKIFQRAQDAWERKDNSFRTWFEEEFNIDSLIDELFNEPTSALFNENSRLVNVLHLFGYTDPGRVVPEHLATSKDTYKVLLRSLMRSHFARILEAPKYVSSTVQHFYFSKAREYQIAGILEKEVTHRQSKSTKENRLEVIDLPSLKDKATTLLAINTILSMEWERARREWGSALEEVPEKDVRVPTFIVVDEAHNLIPDKPRGNAETALREQFRTIIAEGRKYGLYLILVSQRPDKLDSLIISECENKAIMKLSSLSVLNITKQMLGLDDVYNKLLEKTLELEKGRVLLMGRWAQDNPQLFYCAARRTVEGGRNLCEDHWASPYADERTRRVKAAKASRKSTKVVRRARKQ